MSLATKPNSLLTVLGGAYRVVARGLKRGPHLGIQRKKHGILVQDGTYVYEHDIIVLKQRPRRRINFHPGLNVRLAGNCNNLQALKEGTVWYTCENPNLDFSNSVVKKYYPDREGTKFFKKYVHVVPKPQHTLFKCINTV